MTMMDSYFKLNEEYREKYGKKTLLLYQVGAFFEVYTKVGKSKEIIEQQILDYKKFADLNTANKSETILMMGFRDYMLEKYIDKIQNNGYTAVVYVQDENKTNTTRSLLNIFSPGTYFNASQDDKLSNYISCVWIQSFGKNLINKTSNCIIGMACIDNFTGKGHFNEISVENFHNPTTYDCVERFITSYNASETIFISNIDENKLNDIINFVNLKSAKNHIISFEDSRVKNVEKQIYQKELLNKFFSYEISESLLTSSLEYTIGLQSYIFLLDFINNHNARLLEKIEEPIIQNKTDYIILGNHSLKQLNIIEDNNYKGKLSSISNLLNNCITNMGKRSFNYQLLNPYICNEKMENKYNITEYTLEKHDWKKWRELFKNLRDIEKIKKLINLKKITPKYFYFLFENLSVIKNIYILIEKDEILLEYLHNYFNMDISLISNNIIDHLNEYLQIDVCKDIDSLDIDTNIFKKGKYQELDDIMYDYNKNIKELETIRIYLDSLIGIKEKSKKNDFVVIHETDKSGIFLQCTKRRSDLLKAELKKMEGQESVKLNYKIDFQGKNTSFLFPLDIQMQNAVSSKINIVNSYIQTICNKIVKLKTKLKEQLKIAYHFFINDFNKFNNRLKEIIEFCIQVDLIQNMCYIAHEYSYCKPNVKTGEKSYIKAKKLRHPLIERLLIDDYFVPNDLTIGLEDENYKDILLLYGTNAVGKTSFIRSIGIITIMAQSGLYVPCESFEFVPYESIFTRILGNDNLFKGLSTFGVEMSELRVILKMANQKSLILGDELCSGTEHDSALSIFVSGLQKLSLSKATCIFATHLHEIVTWEEIEKLTNLDINHMTVEYDKEHDCLVYDRILKKGAGESMYGLEVCKSLHMPDDFLENAYKIRNKYKNDKDFLEKKPSHFNSKKIVDKCEVCHKNLGQEVHHLEFQKDAINNKIGIMHKNHLSNLISVCESCHNKIHKENKKIKKKKTTKGMLLIEK
jgi:DNA mismatch repair protein MutS